MPRPFGQNDYLFSKYFDTVLDQAVAVTLQAHHVYSIVELANAAAQTVTIPAGFPLTEFPLGAQCILLCSDVGGGSLEPAPGVTINGGAGAVALEASYGSYILVMRDTETNWLALRAVSTGGTTDAFTVKATVADTTPSFLGSKLADGTFITFAVLNPGANEQVEISFDAATFVAALLDTVHVFTANQSVAPVALVDAATILVDAAESNNFGVTLGGNRTLDNPTNLTAGMVLNFQIVQDGTGNRTLAFDTLYTFPGGSAPVASTGAGEVDFMSCYYDGTALRCNYTKAYA